MEKRKNKSKIPKGFYCYDKNGICPYWSKDLNLPEQENGCCSFLKTNDFKENEKQGIVVWKDKNGNETKTEPHDIPISLLWNQVKECGENEYTDKEIEELIDER
jgi:hypothetical protein